MSTFAPDTLAGASVALPARHVTPLGGSRTHHEAYPTRRTSDRPSEPARGATRRAGAQRAHAREDAARSLRATSSARFAMAPAARATTRDARRWDRANAIDRSARDRRVAQDRAARERAPRVSPLDLASSALGWMSDHRRLVVALASVIVVAAMILGPVRTYYQACRAGQDLQMRQDVLAGKNEDLRSDIKRLQTQEGIEDEARKRGYVGEGENSLTVEGLDTGETQADPSAKLTFEDTRDLPTRLLDGLFGYDPEETLS